MNSAITKYLARIGSKGGKKKGAVKARTKQQARYAANCRWKKYRKNKRK